MMCAPMSATSSISAPSSVPSRFAASLSCDLRGILAVVVHVLFARQRHLDRPAGLERQRHADGDRPCSSGCWSRTCRRPGMRCTSILLSGMSKIWPSRMRTLWMDCVVAHTREAAVRLGLADGRLGLHLHVVDLGRLERALDDDVGLGKRLARYRPPRSARSQAMLFSIVISLSPCLATLS